MAKVFVSYSRKDIEFARWLTAELQKSDLDFWIDWEGIPPTVDWWKEIEKGIEESDVFLFLISPDSAKSKVCGQEIETAVKNGKRLIPLVVRDIAWEDTPPHLGHLNYIFFRANDDFDGALSKLLTALHTDFEWVQTHRQLQVKALEWERHTREQSFLLHGRELQDAELQLATNTSKEPHPTDLQREYVFESRRAADRQRTVTTSISITGIIALAALAVFGFYQAGQATNNAATAQSNLIVAQTAQAVAVENENAAKNAEAIAVANEKLAEERAKIARAGELDALANSEKDNQLDLALLFAVEALHTWDNFRSEATIYSLLNLDPELVNLNANYPSKANYEVDDFYFSSDGKRMITTTPDDNGTINSTVWDIDNINDLLEIHAKWSVTDDSQSVSLQKDVMSTLWDVSDPANSSKIATIPGFNPVYSPDGAILSVLNPSSDGYSYTLWDISDPAEPYKLTTFPASSYFYILFSADGRLLATSGPNGGVTLVDLRDRNHVTITSIPLSSMAYHFAFSPKDDLLFLEQSDKTTSLCDIRNPAHPLILATLEGHSITSSADGDIVALSRYSSSSLTAVTLWDLRNPSNPEKNNTLDDVVSGTFDFSPNGKFAAWVDSNGKVNLLNLESPDHSAKPILLYEPAASLGSIGQDSKPSFSLDGTMMAYRSYNTIHVWDVQYTPHELETINERNDPSTKLRFGPQNLLVTLNDNRIVLRDMSSIRNNNLHYPPKWITLSNFLGLVTATSPDSKILVTGPPFRENTPGHVWDVSNPAKPLILTNFSEAPILFSLNGKLLVAKDKNSMFTLWDVSNPNNPEKISMVEDKNPRIQLSPDNKILITSHYEESEMVFWNISDPANPEKLGTFPSSVVGGGVFSNDGKMFASGSTIWNLQDLTSIKELVTLSESGSIAAFSPDGKELLTSDPVALWDIRNPSMLIRLSTIDENGNGVVSSDWKTLAVTSRGENSVVTVWDISNNTKPSKIAVVPWSGTGSVGISPDGKLLMLQDSFFDIEAWDISDGFNPRMLMSLDFPGPISSYKFDPTNNMLMVESFGSIVFLDINPRNWSQRACQVAGRNFTRTEWMQYFPNEEYRKTCELWPLEPEESTSIAIP